MPPSGIQPQNPQQQQQPPLTPEQALQLLEKFGLTNILASGGGSASGALENVSNERQIAAALLNDVDGDRMASFNAFAPPIFAPRQSNNSATSSNFSPFSPDPSYLGERANNDASVPHGPSVPHGAKSYTPWYTGQDDKVASANGKVSPTSAQAARSSNVSQRFTSFLGDSSSSGTFQPTRTSSRQEGPIARPEPTRRMSQKDDFGASAPEPEVVRDVNGTLASLALDEHENA